jgi:hypothetical protein
MKKNKKITIKEREQINIKINLNQIIKDKIKKIQNNQI